MTRKRIRIDITTAQWALLWRQVFSQAQLSGEQRRKVARALVHLPSNGATVDVFCEGRFVGAL